MWLSLVPFGFFLYVFIPITYEELMFRLSPYFLVTVNLLITMGSFTVTIIVVQIFGFAFKNPSKQPVQMLMCVMIAGYMVIALLTVKARLLGKVDDNRVSVRKRRAL
jgi:hypothetical protein